MKLLFLAIALLWGMSAYADGPTASLSLTINPTQTASGCLSDSICPPGITYSIALDEEMSKGYLSSAWHFIIGEPWGCNCYSDGVDGVSWPGDGTLTINGWPAENISPLGLHGGVTILSAQNFSEPGYYEMKAIMGSDWNAFFTVGNYSCPPMLPDEMDFVENPTGRGALYASTNDGNTDNGNTDIGCGGEHAGFAYEGNDLTNAHIYGFDVSTTRGLTAYVDGVAAGNLPYAYLPIGLCTDAPVCGQPIALQAGGPGGDGVPMKIYWVRYYTEVPQ
jgi:hypothetical protein